MEAMPVAWTTTYGPTWIREWWIILIWCPSRNWLIAASRELTGQ